MSMHEVRVIPPHPPHLPSVLLLCPVLVLAQVTSHPDRGDICVCLVLYSEQSSLCFDDLLLPFADLILFLSFLATCNSSQEVFS